MLITGEAEASLFFHEGVKGSVMRQATATSVTENRDPQDRG